MDTSNIKYVTLDGRGNEENFQNCVLDALKELKPGQGLHIIKEFEPFPLYELMKKKGFDKKVEQKAENEFHAWFLPKTEAGDEMKQHLELDKKRLDKIMEIKLKVFKKELTPAKAKELVKNTFDSITPEEFAYGEQQMLEYGITDEAMVEDMDDIIEVFQDVLKKDEHNLPDGHPIQTYLKETEALEDLVSLIEQKTEQKFIKNEWLGLYEKLNEINIHFSRKQNQLFSALEQKGFDRPSKVMWTFDNKVRDTIKDAYLLLEKNEDKAFLAAQPNVIHLVRDILDKEKEILYPTSLKLLSDTEFAEMRKSDDEIGYCLIDNPPPFGEVKTMKENKNQSSELLNDLVAVLQKYGISAGQDAGGAMDVSMGKLTLEQINLVFKHLQIDLSYVDENDMVKFYSDTKHRVFPRSAGVIGRKVQNCHPRESVETVEEIIHAFRKGEQDKAEFWLEMDGKFIYIIYNAVRDDEGNFRGVLEMMQDVTHIRSLTGSQKLLTWNNEKKEKITVEEKLTTGSSDEIHSGLIIAPLLKQYPFLKKFLIELNPRYKQLNNPVVFNTMGNVATLSMIAGRGGYEVDEFVELIKTEIKNYKNK